MGATTNLVNQSRMAAPIIIGGKGAARQVAVGMKAQNLNQTQPLQLLLLDNVDSTSKAEHADLLRLKSAALEEFNAKRASIAVEGQAEVGDVHQLVEAENTITRGHFEYQNFTDQLIMQ